MTEVRGVFKSCARYVIRSFFPAVSSFSRCSCLCMADLISVICAEISAYSFGNIFAASVSVFMNLCIIRETAVTDRFSLERE